MENIKRQIYNFSLFIMGYLFSYMLFTISRLLDIYYNVSLSPPIYTIYIPVIFWFISKRIITKYFICNYKDLIFICKGCLSHFIFLSCNVIMNCLLINPSTDYLAYTFIINCAPLLTNTFLIWIYYYIKEAKYKISEFLMIDNVEEDNNDNKQK